MTQSKHIYKKDKRDTIVVRLEDGMKIKISNRARSEKLSFSVFVRLAISKLLGI